MTQSFTRRKIIALLFSTCLVLTLSSLLASFWYFNLDLDTIYTAIDQTIPESWAKALKSKPVLPSWVPSNETIFANLREGTDRDVALENVPFYLNAAMNPTDTFFHRLQCPEMGSLMRYTYLARRIDGPAHRKYLFALDLYNSGHIIPRLMSSIIETCKFLGPRSCMLSVVEGRSTDGTYETLKLLAPQLQELGILYFMQTDDIDPGREAWRFRIETLSGLRNLAMEPFVQHADEIAEDATVIFLNDVSICREDILELIHQREFQQADMICGMDWAMYAQPVYYDAWIGRGINGDTFFEIPREGNWLETPLFLKDDTTRKRLDQSKPFQVFACWNGGAVFTFDTLKRGLQFRAHQDKECYQGEPQLWCKDMWYAGLGRIAVVPSVNLGYEDADAKRIKKIKGYVYQHVERENEAGSEDNLIAWQSEPPEQVKCVVNWGDQYWSPWNETLPIDGYPKARISGAGDRLGSR